MNIDGKRYRFPGQHPTEVVLAVIHRHWFNIFFHFLIVVVLAALFIGSYVILPYFFPELQNSRYTGFFLFVQNTFFIFLWLFGFLVWIDYYFDIWIVTNERIVNIEQKGLFIRTTSEMRFSRVQDVSCIVNGILPTVLNFGDLHVHTAGHEDLIIFRQVPDPYKIKEQVMKLARAAHEQPV